MSSNHHEVELGEWLGLSDGRRVFVAAEDPFQTFEEDIRETAQRLRQVIGEMERCALNHVQTVRTEFERGLGNLVALRADDPTMKELNGEIIAVQVRGKGSTPKVVDLDANTAARAVRIREVQS